MASGVDCDVEVGFVSDPESGLAFPTVTLRASGIKPGDPVGLLISSTPVDGADKGACPMIGYPIELASTNPAQHADGDGNFAYGPQNAQPLFPDGLKREIKGTVVAVIGEASTTAHFG